MLTKSSIKQVQNVFRKDEGVSGDAQRIEQLAWLLFLKIFDDSESEIEALRPDYVSPIPKALRWRTWAAPADGLTGSALMDFVNGKLFPGLQELRPTGPNAARTGIVRDLFRNAKNYMTSGTLLREVVNRIQAAIDLSDVKERHLLGDVYETILKDLQSAGNAGEFYTPRPVVQFMVDQIAPKPGEIVLDPACGTGGFLAAAWEAIKKAITDPDLLEECGGKIRGVEKKPLPHVLGMTNMLLHGLETPSGLQRGNMLTKPLAEFGPADQVDIILANPPFGGEEESGTGSNYPEAFRTTETADLFLVLMIRLLKEGGRAAIVLPDGSLFGEGVKQRIRQHLLESCDLHTIVRLPEGVFAPYTSIRSNLLFFTKGKPTEKTWYYDFPYPDGLSRFSKTRPIQLEHFDGLKKWWENKAAGDHAWSVTREELEATGWNLDRKNPNAKVEAQLTPEEALAAWDSANAKALGAKTRLQEMLASWVGGSK